LTTDLLDRVPVDAIRTEAHEIRWGRLLLTLLVGIFWLIGFVAGKVAVGLAYCWVAVKVGWKEAHGVEVRPRARSA
jgi:hypothetical protein